MPQFIHRLFAQLRLTLLCGAAFVPASAFAHVVLVQQNPIPGSEVVSPVTVQLRFNAPIEMAFTHVRVTDAAGRPVRVGKLLSSSDHDEAYARLGSLPAGRYLVSWQTAARDGHPSGGHYGFTVH